MTSEKNQQPDLTLNIEPDSTNLPTSIDRRAFMMRSAMIGAVAVLEGAAAPTAEATAARAATAISPMQAAAAPPLSPDLDVVKKSKGPVMTTIDEFYKVGPGPSSSHTIGPMRITYDFYQRCTKLPADQLAKATALKVHLFGSLSATGKGHGTERASLAGIIGKEPATIDPLFLDELRDKPDQVFPVKLGDKTFNASLKDIIYDAPKGDFKHPNTMTCKLVAGDTVLLEQEYYSVGGGFIEWKGYQPPKKGQPKYPYSTMKELLAHAQQNKLTVAQVAMANEVAVSGQERSGRQRVHRQGHHGHGEHRQDRPVHADGHASGADQAQDEGGRGLQARDGRQVREAAGPRRGRGLRLGGIGRERTGAPRRYRTDWRIGRGDARPRLLDR
jgi:L-serine dehydratase